MKFKDAIWPLIGIGAVVFSCWLLFREVRTISLDQIWASFVAITPLQWVGSVVSAIVAYIFLAYYDRLALRHLGRSVPFPFVAATSFATYALSHNIGASVFSGAVVRYRAYRSRGLSGSEIALLIAFCSFTFGLGVLLVSATSLLIKPDIIERYFDIHSSVPVIVAGLIVVAIAFYVFGSFKGFKPLSIGKFHLHYPRRDVVVRQLIAAPMEIAAAASIIYFALPPEHNPGFIVVLAIFVVSFSLALVSHAPGGLGVLEVTFLAGLSDVPETDVLAALLVFRILYLLIPFAIAIVLVLLFEQSALWRRRSADTPPPV
ncbi:MULTISPECIES: lysylphosphatidylglycerol synthase transmembrane domain-containing protein [unclassified Aureimonas]|uniref:lysylphosphatidylglycerol synthase transmembrane domain-containing protein n=1 Tax=unclassified Aureimonas TaxID=2615206 RepID=UPI000784B80D|nr:MULTISPECIES: YbhN family protein [unclassified Aureimonas]